MDKKRFETDELIYRSKIMEIHRVGVMMPDGKVVGRDWAHYNGVAIVLPVLDDGSIVFIRNYRFAVDEFLWELPAGMVEEDEDPAVCAARELTEETGYSAGKVEKLGDFFCAPGTSDEVTHSFLATGLVEGEQNLETYEQITVEVLSQADVKKMILDGTIHDAKSITALTLYWMGQGRGISP